jgi:hypothetical protein
MPKRTNTFQRLIYVIQHKLSNEAVVTESKMLPNIHSGSLVEVDVVIETETGGIPVVVSVECTTSDSRAATVEWVREMIGKHQDLPTNKLVLVSGSSFSDEAVRIALAHNIEAITFNEANSYDWSNMLSTLVDNPNLNIARFDIKVRSWSVKFDELEKEKIKSKENLSFDVTCKIYGPSRELLGTVQQLGHSMLQDKRMVERIIHRWVKYRKDEFQLTWNSPDGTEIADIDGNKYRFRAFVIDGYCDIESTPVSLTPGTYGATQIVYGHVPDIFTRSTGEVMVVFTEREGEEPKGALGFSSGSGFGKAIFPINKPYTTYDPSQD